MQYDIRMADIGFSVFAVDDHGDVRFVTNRTQGPNLGEDEAKRCIFILEALDKAGTTVSEWHKAQVVDDVDNMSRRELEEAYIKLWRDGKKPWNIADAWQDALDSLDATYSLRNGTSTLTEVAMDLFGPEPDPQEDDVAVKQLDVCMCLAPKYTHAFIAEHDRLRVTGASPGLIAAHLVRILQYVMANSQWPE
jgi:hypothetical protein